MDAIGNPARGGVVVAIVVPERRAKAPHMSEAGETVVSEAGEMVGKTSAAEVSAAPSEVSAAKAPTEVSPAEVSAAHASAAAEPAAHVAATEPPAHMSATTEPPAVSTPTTVSTPAARERVSGQSPGESGSRRQNDHSLA
jgi:hypothetical protein